MHCRLTLTLIIRHRVRFDVFTLQANIVEEEDQSLAWVEPKLKSEAPSARYGHSLTPLGGKFYCFGGIAEVLSLADEPLPNSEMHVLTLRGEQARWSVAEPDGDAPPPRWQHSTTPVDDKLLVVRKTPLPPLHSNAKNSVSAF